MNLNVSNDTASETTELTFPNQEHLAKAVASGTSYQIENQVFVVFILAEDDGCTICWARGDATQDPMGESFTRFLYYPSLEEAKAALIKVESIILATLAAETEIKA